MRAAFRPPSGAAGPPTRRVACAPRGASRRDAAAQRPVTVPDLSLCWADRAVDIYGCSAANSRRTTSRARPGRCSCCLPVTPARCPAIAALRLGMMWVWGRWDRLNDPACVRTAPRLDMTAGEPGGAQARPIHVTETLVADTALGSVPADWDADRAVTALYSSHYRSLVRLAALLVRDVATAEEVVQDSFVAMHGGWRRLRDSDKALSYLRQSVVNRSRSVLRHRVVVDRNAPKPAPDMPSAEHGAIVLLERSAVVSALRTLPPRQREALVLRYYGDMSEAQIASVMGISRGAVKSHTARAMSALRSVLERET